jgi:mannose-6-phosphate isomerase
MSAPHPIAAALAPPNPVWRSYVGGRELRHFRSLPDGDDDHFPEDWLASTVCARNGKHAQHPREGLSRVVVSNREHLVADLLRQAPDYWLGTAAANPRFKNSTGVLWKLLDAAVRLQFQAHPSAQFARQHLHSNAGKTECWFILGTRGDAHVHLGFQRPPARAEWARMIREQDVAAMSACFDKIPVQPGDCYVVPAGTPHAIGAGVFMMELMEPTDWVVRCETANAGLSLTPDQCFMGLNLEACLDIFDYRTHSIVAIRQTFQQPRRRLQAAAACTEEELISPAWHQFFRLHRWHGTGPAVWAGNELMLLIALKGGGELKTGTEVRRVQAGETWLLPAAAAQWEWRNPTDDWEFLLAKLPLPPNP